MIASIITQGLLNLRMEYKFKDNRAQDVSNIVAIIDIPPGTNYVSNSLTFDGQIANNVKESSSQVTLPLSNLKGVIRFSIRPTQSTKIDSAAKVSFKINGGSLAEYVGTIAYIAHSNPATIKTSINTISPGTVPGLIFICFIVVCTF
jgi:hypothetical protein